MLLLITAINFVNHSSSFPIIPLYSNFFGLYSTLGWARTITQRTERNKLGPQQQSLLCCWRSHHHPQPPSADLRSSEGRNVKQKNMRCSPLLLSKSKVQEESNHMMTSYPLGFLTVVMKKMRSVIVIHKDSTRCIYARHGASHR